MRSVPTLARGAGDLLYLLGFVGFFAVPFLVYLSLLWSGAIDLPPSRQKGAGRRLFGPLFIGYYYWMMSPVFGLALRSDLTPNHITILTFVVAVVAAVSIGSGHFALASALLIVGGSLDIVDGQLARAKRMTSLPGAFLDSTVDRICDGLIFSGCVVYYAGTPIMLVSLVVLIASFTVSYARSRGEALGIFGSEGLMQRADRLTVLGIALALSPFFGHRAEGFVPHPFYWITAGSLCLLAVLSIVTAFTRIVWTLNQLEKGSPLNAPEGQHRPPEVRLLSLGANGKEQVFNPQHERALGVDR
jgi:phosphatidylglycerophosphate synthase